MHTNKQRETGSILMGWCECFPDFGSSHFQYHNQTFWGSAAETSGHNCALRTDTNSILTETASKANFATATSSSRGWFRCKKTNENNISSELAFERFSINLSDRLLKYSEFQVDKYKCCRHTKSHRGIVELECISPRGSLLQILIWCQNQVHSDWIGFGLLFRQSPWFSIWLALHPGLQTPVLTFRIKPGWQDTPAIKVKEVTWSEYYCQLLLTHCKKIQSILDRWDNGKFLGRIWDPGKQHYTDYYRRNVHPVVQLKHIF